MFDDQDAARVHAGVQAGGGCSAAIKWAPTDPDSGRAWDPAFHAAQLALDPEWRGAAIAGEWDGRHASGCRGSPGPSPADQAAEVARLRRELERTRVERDILKKAIGIFSETPR